MHAYQSSAVWIRIGYGAALVLSWTLLSFWSGSETARSDDLILASRLMEVSDALDQYFRDHNQYPPLPATVNGGLDWPNPRGACLTVKGFVALDNDECGKDAYLKAVPILRRGALLPTEAFRYTPRASDGSPCSSRVGCPTYEIPAVFKSDLLGVKGAAVLTPTGFRSTMNPNPHNLSPITYDP